MKKISIVSSCYNEEANVEELCRCVKLQMEQFENKYEWEQIIIDNASKDKTADKLRELALKDKRIKVILNTRNFGHIRSPYWALMNAYGDAVIYLASDLQDPPELISEFIKKWEEGYKIVLGQKNESKENFLLFNFRKLYYSFIKKIADDETEIIKNCTGFGLFDKKVIELARRTHDSYPFFRGFLAEIGFEIALIPFVQPLRKKGRSKNNFYTLYDNAMIGIVKHSKVPLRIMVFLSFILSAISMFVAFIYFIYKLLNWDSFSMGIAPIVIGIFFSLSIQLFFMGILGEYVGAIYTRVNKRPLVVEKERINFE